MADRCRALDVLTDIPDRNGRRRHYDELVERAELNVVQGVVVAVASLADVIASKEWADRPKDHEALSELRELRRAQIAVEQEREAAQPREWPEPPGPAGAPGPGPDLGS